MAAQVDVSILIDSAPRHIFGFLHNAREHVHWSGGLKYISEQGPLHQGMSYQTTHVMLGREINSVNLVRQIVPDKLLEINNISGPLSYRVRYALAPAGLRTLVSCSISIASQHAAFNLATPLFEMLIESQLQRDLGNLKTAAEQQKTTGETA